MHRGFQILARAFLGLAAAFAVASCGSGAVGSVVVDPSRITIQPGSDGSPTILYSGLPTTFTITGGTGTYVVSSSNQAVVQLSGPIVGNSLTIVPNPVVVETALVLTARDTGTTTPATVSLIVRPGTVSNNITIAPGSSACSPGVCSGGDAVVTATISQGGIPLPARGVRFDVISGDVRFITSPAGAPETTALFVTTVTDETGAARVRMRALDTAANQTAILQITDLGSGAFQRTTVIVVRATASQTGFFTVPETLTFTGPDNTRCAIGASAEIFIFGGTPPYTVSNSAPSAFATNTNTVNFSGGSFRVTTTGQCASVAIAITDADGRTATVTLTNQPGTNNPPPTPLAVSPSSLALSSCTSTASAIIIGGQTTTYVAASDNGFVLVTVNGSVLTVRRAPGTAIPPVTSATVQVSDGRSIVPVTVSVAAAASGFCP